MQVYCTFFFLIFLFLSFRLNSQGWGARVSSIIVAWLSVCPFTLTLFQNFIGVNFQCQMLVRTEVSKVPERWGLLGLLGGVRPALGICSSLRHQMPMFPVVTLCLLHSERWAVVFGVDCRLGAKVFMGKEGCVCVCDRHPPPFPSEWGRHCQFILLVRETWHRLLEPRNLRVFACFSGFVKFKGLCPLFWGSLASLSRTVQY